MLSNVMVKLFTATLLTLLMTSTGLAGPGKGDGNCLEPGCELIPLSGVEEADVLFMREEEKLARDVYLTFEEQWSLLVFANIASSEQQHMDAVKRLIVRYSLTDPVADEADVGSFEDPVLQTLYVELVARGGTSATEALFVGAEIEEIDILDLLEAIGNANPDHTDIIGVYENLMCGSRNHLRAFVRQIEIEGVAYVPEYLTPEELAAIVDSPVERACGRDDGKGKGKAARKGSFQKRGEGGNKQN